MVPEASKITVSPSHMVLFDTPELKLTVGTLAASTVIVTTLEVAEAIPDGHCTPLKVAYTARR